MQLTWIDWSIVAAYFLLSAGIGFAFTRKGGESLTEYFISGRAVPWWLAGASMVATTFAADTPLVVTGLVSAHGVAGNWLWWNMLMSGMLTVFFFARLWRRANVMTDVEFAEVRYSGKPAAALRVFRALYLAIPINLIILGWVTRAMIKILTISLGLHPVQIAGMTVSGEVVAVFICFVITMVVFAFVTVLPMLLYIVTLYLLGLLGQTLILVNLALAAVAILIGFYLFLFKQMQAGGLRLQIVREARDHRRVSRTARGERRVVGRSVEDRRLGREADERGEGRHLGRARRPSERGVEERRGEREEIALDARRFSAGDLGRAVEDGPAKCAVGARRREWRPCRGAAAIRDPRASCLRSRTSPAVPP